MRCPHCNKELPDTALRCKYCRKVIRKEGPALLSTVLKKIKDVLFSGRNPRICPWSFLDVILLTCLIVLFVFGDPFRLGGRIIDFLRLHFFIFTKEPKLLYYLGIHINTIVLKVILLFLMVLFVKFRRAPFWRSVVFSGKMPVSWAWLPGYIGISVIFRFASMANPLVPNIPLNSVFVEALIIGNIVMIFSILFVAPFVEEILFRGFIYPAFNKEMGIYPSIIFTSILFTLAHYPHLKEEYIFMVIIFVLSVITTYAKAKTGSTWLAIIMHHIYNLVYVVVGFIKYAIVNY